MKRLELIESFSMGSRKAVCDSQEVKREIVCFDLILQNMLFGGKLTFDEILDGIAELKKEINE